MSQVSGTAEDFGGSGVAQVKVKVRRLSDGYWWSSVDGDFVSYETENIATFSSPEWSLSITAGLLDDTSYYVQTQAVDNAGLVESYPGGGPRIFWMDYTAPDIAITRPAESYYNSLVTISGTGYDLTSGIDVAYVAISSGPNFDTYWNPSLLVWESATYWIEAILEDNKPDYVFISTEVPTWQHGVTYRVYAKAQDKAYPSNVSSVISYDFTYDVVHPTSVVTLPEDNGVYNADLVNISGTAYDEPAGIASVEVAIQEAGSGLYWNGVSTFNSVSPVWCSASLSGAGYTRSWTYPVPPLQDGYEYRVYSRANDNAGNQEQSYQIETVTFRFDVSSPVAVVTYPVDGEHYNSLEVISGTAEDGIGIPVNGVEFAIREYDTGMWYDGSSFTVSQVEPYWLVANNPQGTSVVWSTGNVVLQTNYRYEVRARATDLAGNVQQEGITSVVFVYDITPPDSLIQLPVHEEAYASGQLTVISGTADDTPYGEIASASIYIQDTYNSYYWDGTSWQSTLVWLTTTTVPNWSFEFPDSAKTSGHKYIVVSRGQDKAGNYQTGFAVGVSSVEFIYDVDAPVSDVSYPSNQYVNAIPLISGTAVDNPVGSGLYNAGISTTPSNNVRIRIARISPDATYYWSGISWDSTTVYDRSCVPTDPTNPSYEPPNSWKYTEPVDWISDLRYDIYVFAKDDLGQQEPISVKFTLYYDTTPPLSVITYPPDGSKLNGLAVISGTADAYISGLADVKVQISSWTGSGWSVVQGWTSSEVYVSSWVFTLIPDLVDGTTYQVVSKSYDRAGNVEVVLSTVTFVYDVTAPDVVVEKPVANRYYGSNSSEPDYYLDQFRGSVVDAFGVSDVKLQLYDVVISSYWDDSTSSWVSGEVWFDPVGLESWSYDVPLSSFTDGHRYRLVVYAVDLAGNISAKTTIYFLYDITPPDVVLQKPNRDYHNSLPTISGTADADVGGLYRSDMYVVEVSIQRDPPIGEWWDGSQWVVTENPIWLTHTSAVWPDWVFLSTPTWATNTEYLVQCRGKDSARNVSSVVSKQFVYDTQLPLTEVVEPDQQYESYLPTISGTAEDTNSLGALERVEVRVKHVAANLYWNPVTKSWDISDPESAWYVALTTTSYSIWFTSGIPFTSGMEYEVNARAQDKALNYDNVYSTVTFLYDTEVPVSSCTYPGYRYVSSLSQVSGTAEDFGGSGVAQVKVKVRRLSDGYWWSS
ncbi:MAG: hypothetical protein DRP08_03430, partial [Candidatus Aenigmatarchaeota archaeon]